jgi:hypothetical protein
VNFVAAFLFAVNEADPPAPALTVA